MASLESSIRWADGFLLLYSITQRLSFLEVPHLKKLIEQTKQSLSKELTYQLTYSQDKYTENIMSELYRIFV